MFYSRYTRYCMCVCKFLLNEHRMGEIPGGGDAEPAPPVIDCSIRKDLDGMFFPVYRIEVCSYSPGSCRSSTAEYIMRVHLHIHVIFRSDSGLFNIPTVAELLMCSFITLKKTFVRGH